MSPVLRTVQVYAPFVNFSGRKIAIDRKGSHAECAETLRFAEETNE